MSGQMFMHLVKYRIRQTVRMKSLMFWALAFPILLGTFFYISFGSADTKENMAQIPAVAVEDQEKSPNGQAFLEFLKSMDGDSIQLELMTEEEAEAALLSDEAVGIFYCGDKPALTVAGSGISQSILKALMDSYDKNAAMLSDIVQAHPEKMEAAVKAMEQWSGRTENISVKGKTMDSNISYFFALIAYACLSGAFLGVQASVDGQANLSPLGARRSITPTHKIQFVLTDMLALFVIHFINVLILTGYIYFVLGIDLGSDVASILLVEWMGSTIGISLGLMLGCVGRLAFGAKMGLCVLLTLFPGFLAGLMFGQMKDLIEHHCPLVNRVNPAAVLSDAFYCIGVYNDSQRMMRNVGILAVMSVAMILIAYLAVRRVRYDSI